MQRKVKTSSGVISGSGRPSETTYRLDSWQTSRMRFSAKNSMHDQLEGRHARSGELRIREDELGPGGAGAGALLLETLPTRCACRLLVIFLAVELSSSLDLGHMDLEMGIVAEAVVFIPNSSERSPWGGAG